MSTALAALKTLLAEPTLQEAQAKALNEAILECLSKNVHIDEITALLLNHDQAVDALDPLSILPSVIDSRHTDSALFATAISKRCSAKECIIALQEAVEQLHQIIEIEDDEAEDAERLSRAQQVVVVLFAYSHVIPRLALRKKTAHETLKPLFSQLNLLVDVTAERCTKTEGRSILLQVADLAFSAFEWIQNVSPVDSQAMLLLAEIVRNAISSLASYLDSSLSTRTLQSIQPRMAALLRPSKDWEIGEEAIAKSIDILNKLGIPHPSTPSLTNLVLRAHSSDCSNADVGFIESHLSVVIASIQSNTVLDETLTLLCRVTLMKYQLSPEVILPLTHVLPNLACVHPDSTFRFLAFRVFGSLLSSAPPDIRLPALRSLFAPESPPQMRIAAVGLVKEAVLDGLTSGTVFGSPMFLQVFAPILLTLPEDFSEYELEKLDEKGELARLTESLGMYYVVFSRDTHNKTGIRDKDNVIRIQRTLLSPLNALLDRAGLSGQANLSLASVRISLERVQDALRASGF